jgi:hypothetical protein
MLKADKVTEAGVLPSRQALEVMGKYNDELLKAGVLMFGIPDFPGAGRSRAAGRIAEGPPKAGADDANARYLAQAGVKMV